MPLIGCSSFSVYGLAAAADNFGQLDIFERHSETSPSTGCEITVRCQESRGLQHGSECRSSSDGQGSAFKTIGEVQAAGASMKETVVSMKCLMSKAVESAEGMRLISTKPEAEEFSIISNPEVMSLIRTYRPHIHSWVLGFVAFEIST